MAETHRNLLFGILAHQLNFVDHARLLEAMHLWVTNKSQPLGQLLMEKGWLSEERHRLLEALVNDHLAQHDGDPARSLAALGSTRDACPELTGIYDEDLERSLSLVRRGHSGSARGSARQRTTPFPAPPPTSERFRIIRLHNQGGLGRVWVAQDSELNREVALKEIKDEYANDQSSRARFLLEAEITGGLEHPGIVPVYDLRHQADGRPYYVMRFIRGESFRTAIHDYHRADWPQREPGERTIELRRLLNRFLDVCNAVDYAHSRGVLHRDIKPDNIMLGEYGETVLLDWGLAKTADAEQERGPSQASGRPQLRPVSLDSVDATVLGSAVGSPPFMSPEQARGEHDQLGPQTDVYGLGATLYMLLTNQIPISGDDREEMLNKVKHGEWLRPRAVKRDVPRALEAICMKAMALRQEDRYQTVQPLAREIERWLANEPVLAYREPIWERVARVGRRHRTLFRTVAAALLVITLLSILYAVSFFRQTQRAELARAEAEAAKERTERVLEYLVEAFRSPDPERDGRTVTVAEVLDRAVEKLGSLTDDSRDKTQLLDAFTETYLGLGIYQDAIRTAKHAVILGKRFAGVDHPNTLDSLNNLAAAYQKAGQLDKALPIFEETLQIRRQLLGENHPDTIDSMDSLAAGYQERGQFGKALPLHERALQLRRATLGENHPDTLKSMHNLAAGYKEAGQLTNALPLLQTTVELRRTQLGEDHPDTLNSMNTLAAAYRTAGQLERALPLLAKTLELRQAKLGDEHPHTLNSMNNLATAYRTAGQLDKALPLLERTLEIRRARLGENHPETLNSFDNLANALHEAGQIEHALPLLERTLELRQATLGRDHPRTMSSMNNLASALQAAGQIERAVALLEDTVELRCDKLGEQHQETLISMGNLASAYQAADQLDKAIPLYERTFELMRETLGSVHHDTLNAMNNLAAGYYADGQVDKALPLMQETLKLRQNTLGKDHPQTLNSMGNLASTLHEAGQVESALSLFQETLELTRAKQGDHHPYTRSLMRRLGELRLEIKEYPQAELVIRAWLAALDQLPQPNRAELAQATTSLAAALLGQHKVDQAIEQARSAVKLLGDVTPTPTDLHRARSLLGSALAAHKKWEEAAPLLTESYRRLKKQLPNLRPHQRWYVTRACEQIVTMYRAQNKPDDVATWEAELESVQSQIDRLRTRSVDDAAAP
jgi:serine/threonine protein kinase